MYLHSIITASIFIRAQKIKTVEYIPEIKLNRIIISVPTFHNEIGKLARILTFEPLLKKTMQVKTSKTVQLYDKQFSTYMTAEEIEKAVGEVAEKINSNLVGENPLFVCVLNGVFIFAADLLRKITIDCEVSFVKVSSYEGTASTGVVKTQIGLNEEIKGRTLVVVEDIVDSGNTIEKLLNTLKQEHPKEIKIAALLYKPSAFKKNFKIDYIGVEIPNDFVVGYGLDYNGLGRNLPEIYKIVE